MMPTFYEAGPSCAPNWRKLERDWRKLVRANRVMRWVLPVFCMVLIACAPYYAGIPHGGLLMGVSFFVSFFGARRAWRDHTRLLAKSETQVRECGEIAADMELGLWPARWADLALDIPREAMWRAIERERGE